MKRVLLLGGYGGFGARIAARLATAGWEVLVAGRSRAKAEEFCARGPGLIPVELDRDRGIEAALAEFRPFALVDAAGPFQRSSYAVPRACIAARCHYVDIADARGFVCGIDELDGDARAAGVSVVSGASSVPGLSGAVVRSLVPGMERVTAVEIAITASSRATGGPSVVRAILSYVGKPVRVWRARRWTTAFGWQELRWERFEVAGFRPMRRLLGLAEVPDMSLLPERLPGRPATSFRAGAEFSIYSRALAALGWFVRRGWLRSLDPLSPLIVRIQAVTAKFGGDRSAMIVRVFGVAGGRRVERRWTLIANRGDGPEIPTLAVPIVLQELAAGAVPLGAIDAGVLLTLDQFEPAFRQLAVRHATAEIAQPQPLYRRVMGSQFDALPPAVRAMHLVLRDHGAQGRARVACGRHRLSRFVARIFRFPPEGEHDLHVAFLEKDGVETWTRDFGGSRFRSELSEHDGRLVERFGPFRFVFELQGSREGLAMHIRGWFFGPVKMPLALAPRSTAREWEADGRFNFDVPIALPVIGLLVHYSGWLVSDHDSIRDLCTKTAQ